MEFGHCKLCRRDLPILNKDRICKECETILKNGSIANPVNKNYLPYKFKETHNRSSNLIQLDIFLSTMKYSKKLCDNYYCFLNDLVKSIENDIKNTAAQKNFNNEDIRNIGKRDYRCSDGHYVRSKAEQIIDDWLYNNGIIHAYEKSIFMETNPDTVILCDFYLPQKDIYIEFWGLQDDEKYLKRKQEKIKLYDENNIKRIDLTEKDIKCIDDIMPRLLAKFKKGE